MEQFFLSLTRSFILFGRNLMGIINAPYVTYRKLAKENVELHQTLFIPLLVISYFIFVATLRTGIKNPFLLTLKLNILLFASLAGFIGMLILFYVGGRLVGSRGNFRQIYTLWIYSLIPTLVWFFTTSILYLILPPPRTISFAGKLYSMVFLAFSFAVFIWKIILYYLTLRFSLKLDLWRISKISILVVPTIVAYSLIMYELKIFRIPFL